MMYIQVLKGQSITVICEMFQHNSSPVSHIIHEGGEVGVVSTEPPRDVFTETGLY